MVDRDQVFADCDLLDEQAQQLLSFNRSHCLRGLVQAAKNRKFSRTGLWGASGASPAPTRQRMRAGRVSWQCERAGPPASLSSGDIPVGLVINFHEKKLIDGVVRMILPGANR